MFSVGENNLSRFRARVFLMNARNVRFAVVLVLFLAISFGGLGLLMYFEPHYAESKIDHGERMEILSTVSTAAMHSERLCNLLRSGSQVPEDELAELESELELAKEAVKKWRALEK